MSDEKLIDRYEPLESILSLYKRWGQSSTLIKHIFTFISKNLRVKRSDRKYLFSCMFKHQQQREKKIRNFILTEASELSIEEQQNLIEQLVIQIKRQIYELKDESYGIEQTDRLNTRLYKQLNILRVFKENTRDFVCLFELWQSNREYFFY